MKLSIVPVVLVHQKHNENVGSFGVLFRFFDIDIVRSAGIISLSVPHRRCDKSWLPLIWTSVRSGHIDCDGSA